MNKIQLVGDIHGNFERFKKIIADFDGITIQLGDLGIGFIDEKINPAWFFNPDLPYMIKYRTNFEFIDRPWFYIRGNHDFPSLCQEHPNYLGDYGIYKGKFFLSGAWSIDKEFRTVGVDWWEDEELTIAEGYKAMELYDKEKPKIVLTHDCPTCILKLMYSRCLPTRTGQLLDAMLKLHTPEAWYFGHHHESREFTINGCFFKCLNSNETVTIGE